MRKKRGLRLSRVRRGRRQATIVELQVTNLGLWALMLGLLAATTLPLRQWTIGTPMPVGWRALYSALHRPAFAIVLSWIVVACHYGYGGPIGAALNWRGWQPLGKCNRFVICVKLVIVGKLTYCAYLVHIVVLIQFIGYQYRGVVFTSVFQAVCNRSCSKAYCRSAFLGDHSRPSDYRHLVSRRIISFGDCRASVRKGGSLPSQQSADAVF